MSAERDAAVLAAWRRGWRWKEIAERLGVSRHMLALTVQRCAGPADRAAREAAAAARREERLAGRKEYYRERWRRRLRTGPVWTDEPGVPPPRGPDIFAGARFADDPRARAEPPALRLLPPPPRASGCGCALG